MDRVRSGYRWRLLELPAHGKPLDFGGGGINGSVDKYGRITAINAYHPAHGYVTLTGSPPFPEAERYNPEKVRAYRAGLVETAGFGLYFSLPVVRREAWLIEDAIPCIRLTLANGILAEAITFVPSEHPNGVVQWWRFSEAGRFAYFGGRFSLQRCAYTQLTEGGPIPIPSPRTRICYQDGELLGAENSALGWCVFMTGAGGVEIDDGTIAFSGTEPVYLQQQEVALYFGQGLNQTEAMAGFEALQDTSPARLLENTLDQWGRRWQGWQFEDHPADLTLRRGLVYGLNCCVPMRGEATCIITDHQLLPLSWNRDAYYVAMALLHWRTDMAEVIRGHLLWMFEIAERPEGTWGRSYLANGALKDPAFQLDQQLFPLLELADYLEVTGDKAIWGRLRGQAAEIIAMLLAIENDGLFPTDETPADDPVAMPYHLSSHILLWHTFRKLAVIMDDPSLSAAAQRVYEAIWRHFAAAHEGQSIFAYLTDGRSNHQFYHDANDLPLALAPFWGFCSADEPVWRATMQFAFSPENKGGYYPGEYGGLGSVHTRNTWPLGDVQAYIAAKLTGDRQAEAASIARLQAVSQGDGALPEAYSAATGEVVSRHWFSWPGASFALMVGDFR